MTFGDGLWRVTGAARLLGVGALAGAGAGLVAGGLGSRLAMRISAMATGPSCAGLVTENGNRCGEITLGGTFGLLVFAALFFGLFGGLVHMGVRSWLTGLDRWRGLAFGLLLLAGFGSMVIEGHNPDFNRFASPGVNIPLFALLFPAFGLLIAPLAGWLDRALPLVQLHRPWRLRSLAAWLLVAAGVLSMLLIAALTVDILGQALRRESDLQDVVLLSLVYDLLLLAPAMWTVLQRGKVKANASPGAEQNSGQERRGRLTMVGYALLPVPLLAGVASTVQAIYEIASG